MYGLVQADRLGAAPAFDAAGTIGDLHTEALSLQVLHPARSAAGTSDMTRMRPLFQARNLLVSDLQVVDVQP